MPMPRFMRMLALCLIALAGCAGVGVVATSDPAAKLRDAGDLFERQDRPLIAERLIREAIGTYQSNDDQLGLAEAYRTYGFFFRSRSIDGKWNKYYRENGFLDKSATFDSRYVKSIDYFEKARTIFEANKRFDALTNVDLNVGFTYAAMGNRSAACQAFDKSIESNRANLRENPTAKPALPKGFSSYEVFVADRKKQYGCDRTVENKIYTSAYLVAHGGRSSDMDALIKQELLLHHIAVSLGPEPSSLDGESLVVRYEDHWWWNLVMRLRSLHIQLYDGESGVSIVMTSLEYPSVPLSSTAAVKQAIDDLFVKLKKATARTGWEHVTANIHSWK